MPIIWIQSFVFVLLFPLLQQFEIFKCVSRKMKVKHIINL